jgi:copper chaperone CopZ
MKIISNITMAFAILFSFSACSAQINNIQSESVNVDGNCSMCKKTIESAGNMKKIAKVDWDKATKIATITFDSTLTNRDEILKRIALAGYDSEQFLAPDDAYSKLPSCCQYDRIKKSKEIELPKEEVVLPQEEAIVEQPETIEEKPIVSIPPTNQLTAVFSHYFELKDALVKTDANSAVAIAKKLSAALSAVKMESLNTKEHTVWMQVMKDLAADVSQISTSKDIAVQRNHFMRLSENIYDLMKVATLEYPAYYQFCPMANDGDGANWVSKENVVKNPYYGSQMLSCGKVVETIK